jgi:hypothetical protein
MVERVLPGATIDCLDGIRRAAENACRAFTSEGKPVRYLRSIFTPGESRCRCLFEVASGDLVRDVNEAAAIPYSRIILAVHFGLPSGSSTGCAPVSCQEPDPKGL